MHWPFICNLSTKRVLLCKGSLSWSQVMPIFVWNVKYYGLEQSIIINLVPLWPTVWTFDKIYDITLRLLLKRPCFYLESTRHIFNFQRQCHVNSYYHSARGLRNLSDLANSHPTAPLVPWDVRWSHPINLTVHSPLHNNLKYNLGTVHY